MTYTISKAAEMIGVSAPTLRFYDKEGLLPFVDRSESGIRIFNNESIEWLNLIECLKKTGMPIKDIKAFIDWHMEGDSTIEQRRNMFYERKQAVEEQIEALNRTLDMIQYKCWFYDKALETGSTKVPKQMKLQDLPKEIRLLKQKIGH